MTLSLMCYKDLYSAVDDSIIDGDDATNRVFKG